MTIPALPNGFTPVVEGYGLDDPNGVMRTEVSGGFSRYALEFDRGTQRFSITLILDQLQFSIWTAFYHHIIKKGAIAFSMPLDSGFGVVPHVVNIMPGSYSANRTNGIMVVVTFSVEAENQVYEMTAAEAASMIALYNGIGDETGALLARLAKFALNDTLVLG